jgi:hypothetical protein
VTATGPTIINRNGLPVAIRYWPRSVEIIDRAAPPTPVGVGATFASGRVLVGWSAVTNAASYRITATRAEDWSVCGQSRC